MFNIISSYKERERERKREREREETVHVQNFESQCIHVSMMTIEQKLVQESLVSGGSRNFKTGVCGLGAGDFLGSDICFDASSHMPYVL